MKRQRVRQAVSGLPGGPVGVLAAAVVMCIAGCGAQAVGSAPASSKPAAASMPAAASKPASVPAGRGGTGWVPPGPALPPDARAYAARFFVWPDTIDQPIFGGFPLVVYRMRSGSRPAAQVAVVSPPGGYSVSGVAAAGDDRTFVIEADKSARYRFFELRLRPSGKPQPLIPLTLQLPHWPSGAVSDPIALTSDGREIAVNIVGRGQHAPTGIAVISTATGRARAWTWRRPQLQPEDLAWAGDHTIEFVTQASSLRALDIRQPGSHLAASSVLIRNFDRFGLLGRSQWNVTGLTITGDGRTGFSALRYVPPSNDDAGVRQVILRLSTATGQPLGVLTPPANGYNIDGTYCGVLWSDASGRHLLANCGGPYRVDNGVYSRIPLRLAPYVPYDGLIFAW